MNNLAVQWMNAICRLLVFIGYYDALRSNEKKTLLKIGYLYWLVSPSPRPLRLFLLFTAFSFPSSSLVLLILVY